MFYAVLFIEEVVRCPVHLALGRLLFQIVPYLFEFGLQCRKYRWCIDIAPGLHGHFLIGPKAIGLDYSFVAIKLFQNDLLATGTVIIEEV